MPGQRQGERKVCLPGDQSTLNLMSGPIHMLPYGASNPNP